MPILVSFTSKNAIKQFKSGIRIKGQNNVLSFETNLRLLKNILGCGLFEKRFEFCDALLRHHDLGPWHGGLADVAVGSRVRVFEQTGLAQDLYHILLGEVGPYFLVGTDDDVIGLGVPCVAQEVNGLGVDEGWNHTIAIAGMQESMLRAFGLGGDDVLDGLAHGDWRFAVHHKDEGKSDLQH